MSDEFVFVEQNDEFDWQEIMKGDPGEGVPTGGTTGQILAKHSDTDYDTEWIDPPDTQIQSDWNQDDNTKKDYIKNKPNIPEIDATLTAHTEATDNPHAVTRAQVGLGSVDNTADADKPVSTAQQTALDLKAPLESPALTGMPTAPTAAEGTDNTQIATTAFAKAVAESKAADVEVPLADGDVAAIGISSKFARADHVHPRENLFLIDSITSSKYEISVENGRLRYEEV